MAHSICAAQFRVETYLTELHTRLLSVDRQLQQHARIGEITEAAQEVLVTEVRCVQDMLKNSGAMIKGLIGKEESDFKRRALHLYTRIETYDLAGEWQEAVSRMYGDKEAHQNKRRKGE